MSTKPSPPERSRLSTRSIAAARKFSAGLSDQAVIDAGIGLFIVVALSILLLRDYQRPSVELLQPGSVAAKDIIAPIDLKVEDVVETKRQRAV